MSNLSVEHIRYNLLNIMTSHRVGCVLCGGNIDMTSLQRVIERGLAMDGRAVKFHCDVTDRSGGLNALLEILADHKAKFEFKYINCTI